jgi:site-specific DNA-methyltransferase (adenine-specific)
MNKEEMLNKVICGDCLEVMKDIPDKSIDMILCDLPYGTTACKWDVVIPFEPLWEQYKRIIKDNGAIVLTASQPFTSALVMSNIKMFKYEWIWVKSRPNGFLDANRKPMKKHENILVFYDKLPIYNPQGIILKDKPNKNTGVENVYGKVKKGYEGKVTYTNYPNSILDFASNTNEFHPTQKPVALFEYLIKTYTNEGDLVLDNCAGSGTTGVACKNTNRNYILIEKEPEYIDIINKRLQGLKEI